MTLLYVGLGGALGSVLRYLLQLGAGRWLGQGFPYGTLLVNLLGSLAMGLLMGWLAREAPENGAELRAFLAIGILGGFTTFSAFSLDAISLMQDGKTLAAGIYIFTSLLGSLMALLLGLQLMRVA